ncbi:hypothetical protein PhCBS80983_g01569 [Powellomyces hirtus]|uniref:Uncharacterized protein n=1 Tax=Powellomyces hirtus TaxID=109895 RepID=A0A507EAH1_9FUNG|nr:hypothetical protein PhCBS80983_g01569 [Powellomyces hirtus]
MIRSHLSFWRSGSYLAVVLLSISAFVCVDADDPRHVIGIDFGLLNSLVSVFQDGQAKVIASTPSYVAFTEDQCLVGLAAKNQALTNPENTIFGMKRLIGRSFEEEEVQEAMRTSPFEIFNRDGKPAIKVKVTEQIVSPEETVARILQKLKSTAENYLGGSVGSAVIAVPGSFEVAQRDAIRNAGTIAGFTSVDVYTGATLAGRAYNLGEDKNDYNVLVYSLEYGQFEVSVVFIEDGVPPFLTTLSNHDLGSFNHGMVDHVIKLWERKMGKPFTKDIHKQAMLRDEEAEKAKIALGSQMQTLLNLKSFHVVRDFAEVLTSKEFEESDADLFQKILGLVDNVLIKSGLSKSEIDDIILVGSSSRIPKVADLLEFYFNGKKVHNAISPDKVVAYGAAVQGGLWEKPVREAGCDCDTYTWPAFHLGIETIGGLMINVIPRHLSLPAKNSCIVSTTADNQSTARIRIFEGLRPLCKDNTLLGHLDFEGIGTSSRGAPQIEVTFDVDLDEVLTVSLLEKGTGKSKSIVFNKRDVNEDEIYRLYMERDEFYEEDQLVKAQIEAKLDLSSYVNHLNHYLAEKPHAGSRFTSENTMEIQIAGDANLEGDQWTSTLSMQDRYKVQAAIRRAQEWLTVADAASTAKEEFDRQKSELKAMVATSPQILRYPDENVAALAV